VFKDPPSLFKAICCGVDPAQLPVGQGQGGEHLDGFQPHRAAP
jgi:hypothetical protein